MIAVIKHAIPILLYDFNVHTLQIYLMEQKLFHVVRRRVKMLRLSITKYE